MRSEEVIRAEKNRLRREIRARKKEHGEKEMQSTSTLILERLEQQTLFQEAKCLLFYHALPDEVQTAEFLEKWHARKTILLPVVEADHLLVRRFEPGAIRKGCFDIWEPAGENITDLSQIDLIIVPGMGFDKKGNRLGRGKGFYDRLLRQLKAPKIGIGFAWQLFEEIPTEPFDQPLDGILTDQHFYLNT